MRYLLLIPFLVIGLSGCEDKDKALIEEWAKAEITADICENAAEVLTKHCTDLDIDDPKIILCDKLESNYTEKCTL